MALPVGLIAQLAMQNKKQADEKKEKQKQEIKGLVGGTTSTIGQVMGAMANNPDDQPDIEAGTMGGAIAGAGKGLEDNGIIGALTGFLGGGLTGFMKTAKNREDYDTQKLKENELFLKSNTVSPNAGYAEEGGSTTQLAGNFDLLPLQAEKGENALFPDLSIISVNATEKHEDMPKDKITDVLPKGVLLFSDSDKMMISKDSIDKDMDTLGYTTLFYDDASPENREVNKIKFSDLYKDGETELTPAQLAGRIKKKFKTSDFPKDIFTEATNKANKAARAPYLSVLMLLQENMRGDKNVQGIGDIPTEEVQDEVPKYELAGFVGLDKIPNEFEMYGLDSPEKIEKAIIDGKLSGNDLSKIKEKAEAKGDFSMSRRIDEVFSKMGNRIDQLDKKNEDNRLKRLGDKVSRFREQRGLSNRRTVSNILGTALQSSREEMSEAPMGDLNEMYQDTPESIMTNQENSLRGSNLALAKQLIASGMKPSQVGAMLGQAVNQSEKIISKRRGRFEEQRAANRRARAERVAKVEGLNNDRRAESTQGLRDNQNIKIADMSNSIDDSLNRTSKLRAMEGRYGDAIDREYNTNNNAILQNRINAEGNRLKYDLQSDYYDRQIEAMNNRPDMLYGQRAEIRELDPLPPIEQEHPIEQGQLPFSEPVHTERRIFSTDIPSLLPSLPLSPVQSNIPN